MLFLSSFRNDSNFQEYGSVIVASNVSGTCRTNLNGKYAVSVEKQVFEVSSGHNKMAPAKHKNRNFETLQTKRT